MQLFNVTGIMLSYFVNYGISENISGLSALKWRIPFALQILPGLFLLLLVFENESPRWLVEKNRVADARKALAFIRGKPQEDAAVVQELDEIVEDFHGKERLSIGQQFKAIFENKMMLYRASFAILLMFFQQLTGTNRYVSSVFLSHVCTASSGYYAVVLEMWWNVPAHDSAVSTITVRRSFSRLAFRGRRLDCSPQVSMASLRSLSPRWG